MNHSLNFMFAFGTVRRQQQTVQPKAKFSCGNVHAQKCITCNCTIIFSTTLWTNTNSTNNCTNIMLHLTCGVNHMTTVVKVLWCLWKIKNKYQMQGRSNIIWLTQIWNLFLYTNNWWIMLKLCITAKLLLSRQFCSANLLKDIRFTPSSICPQTQNSFLFLLKKIPGGKGQEVVYLFQSKFHKYQSET